MIRVPPTFTSKSCSESSGRIETSPAMWNTRSTPRRARRTAALSSTSHWTDSSSRSFRLSVLERRRRVSRSSSPRAASSRTTAEPRKPLPPVTSVLPATRGSVGRPLPAAIRRQRARPERRLVPRLVLDAAHCLRDRLEALARDLLAAVDAPAVVSVRQPLHRELDVLGLVGEHHVARLVELLVMGLGAVVGGVLVVVGELRVELCGGRLELRAGRRDLLRARPQPPFHLLFVELCQANPVL